MNERIAQFELVWNAMLNARFPRPELVRSVAVEDFLEIPRFPLVRQTNEHELLHGEFRERWWSAQTAEEKSNILFDFEASNW